MNNLYRFSPIDNETKFKETLTYLAEASDKLAREIFKQSMPLNTLKIFPHYFNEYDYLYGLISKMGSQAPFSTKKNFYVEVDENIGSFNIKYLGLRVVDPYRMQVGCGDYEIKDFEEFRQKYINTSPYVRALEDQGMLEIWHPDFDVLGYVVPAL